ncbi:hypothetical protein jhhlp_008475 [Lomentospora prolificans]|uniref:Carboxylic ester hydrolase n=1 Tax=Lomentospora prolificans TaxID=41688 RepID=A0A2N3MY54_9PEZI|nr:hypothetical protein jhhlp_008475 [Lomentospora prolificans]
MKNADLPILTSLLAGLAPASASFSAAQDCARLAEAIETSLFDDSHITFSDFVEAGRNLSIPKTHPTCEGFAGVVDFDFCRVGITTTTGPSSEIVSEAWLPADWSGRVMTVGNGGLGGCIGYSDLFYTAQRGFSAVGTDIGHVGNVGEPLADPDVLESYTWRAAHVGAQLSKEISLEYYGKEHTKAYYLGCSTGGRQGFVAAQEFPDDFDGIVAGAPAIPMSGLQSWSGYATTITGPPGSPSFISQELWAIIVEDMLKQCDWLDGHLDGILEHTELCNYRPEGLLCGTSGENGEEGCLTGAQADTVRSLLSPLYDSEGNEVFGRMQPGTDTSAILWRGSLEGAYVLGWFRYGVYGNASWNGPVTREDIDFAEAKWTNARGQGWKGDLSVAKDRGLKILHYHGLQDPAISAENSGRYYNHVARTMGLPPSELDAFYRFFYISGMGHCAGGTGASNIGNRLSTLAEEEPEGNVLAAIVQWVEEGVAPDYVLGTAYTSEEKDEIAFQRRHCKYPARNMYKGEGDPDAADSWECVQ